MNVYQNIQLASALVEENQSEQYELVPESPSDDILEYLKEGGYFSLRLRNTNDYLFFQENLNNAEGDFKLKSIYGDKNENESKFNKKITLNLIILYSKFLYFPTEDYQ